MDEPVVQIMPQSFFNTKKGKRVLTAVIAILIFTILAIGLQFIPKKPVVLGPLGVPVKITLTPENYGFKAGNLALPCPVESTACPTQQLINTKNSSAVIYKTASGSSALNVSKLSNLENIAVSDDKKTGKKYFYESVAKDQNSCYTIAYTLPDDAIFGAIMDSDILETASKIATLGTKTFQAEGKDANILIQVRNIPMDPGIPCSLLKKSPDFFKTFN